MQPLTRFVVAVGLALCGLATIANAAELTATCPSNMRYEDGTQLRFNDRFYFPTGGSINVGPNVFYPNGASMMRGTIYSYPTGQTLMTSNATYYPNGNNLAMAGSVFWANGAQLRWGGNFYYDDGTPARIGTTLYLPNGQRTRFPLRLEEEIGSYGVMRINVSEQADNIELVFDRLVTDRGVNVLLTHSGGQQQPSVQVTLDVGNGYESVRLTFQGSFSPRCELIAASPSRFSIQHRVADLDVVVHPGHDPQEVGTALLDALDWVGSRP